MSCDGGGGDWEDESCYWMFLMYGYWMCLDVSWCYLMLWLILDVMLCRSMLCVVIDCYVVNVIDVIVIVCCFVLNLVWLWHVVDDMCWYVCYVRHL